MIYIISGASRSGKTILANRLLNEHNVPFLSTDAIMMAFMNGLPEYGIHDKLWPDVIARKLWPFLEELIHQLNQPNKRYVLEGEAFLPELLRPLMDQANGSIQAIFLGYPNTTLERKMTDVVNHPTSHQDWLLEQSKDEQVFHLNNMIQYSALIQTECQAYGLPFYDVSNDFDGTLTQAMNDLLAIEEL